MRESIYTPNAPSPVGPYSQAIRTANLVFTAGQLGLDPDTSTLAGMDVATQTRQALANIQAILAAAGLGVGDIVKVTIYTTDLALFGDLNAAYAEVFAAAGVAEPPARSVSQVAALPLSALVEIDAIAQFA